MIAEIQRINLGFVNCYLVKTGTGFIVVDTGIPSQRSALEKVLTAAGCEPGNLNLLVLTHGDIDHAGNAAYVRIKYKTRIAMHHGDAAMVASGQLRPRRTVKSPLLKLMHMVMRITGSTEKMAAAFERFTPDIDLEDGLDLREYGFDATVLHIPGHTDGSIAILSSSGDLICGDTLENRGHPRPAGIVTDEAELAASIAKLAQLDITTVYPGHGQPFPWARFALNH